MEAGLRRRLLRQVLDEDAEVFTSPVVSPTGFPFKVAQISDTLSAQDVYDARPRICDMGFLRTNFKREDGSLGYRCPAEPVDDYVRKGGQAEDTVGRSCLCNNLGATAGFPQVRKDGFVEPPLVTTGDDLVMAGQFVPAGKVTYTAKDVIDRLLSKLNSTQAWSPA
jgi:nitronate monooxygenase